MNFKTFVARGDLPLHTQIREWLLNELEEYPLDSKLPTDRALASGLGVAPLTVKRVMGDLEREGYVLRQQGKGTFLASREKRVHAPLRAGGDKGDLVFAYPNYFSYEYWARAHAAEALSLKAGYSLVEFKMNPTTTCDALVDLVKRHPDTRAVFICPVPNSITPDVYQQLDNLGVPVILFTSCPQQEGGRNIYSITPDWFRAGYMRLQYLLDQGHRDIGYVANEPVGQDGGEGWRGTRKCLRDHDLRLRDLSHVKGDVVAWESALDGGYRLTKRLLERRRVTAIITASNGGAMGALRCFWELGLRVPDDISLISYGTASPADRYINPPLTHVATSYQTEMRRAFDIIQDPAGEHPHLIMCEPTLTIGGSVAPPDDASI